MKIYIRKIQNISNNIKESESLTRDSLLKDALGIEYKDLSFNEHGKPYINGSNMHFSISHSNGYVALATSNSIIGIDIEFNRTIDNKILKLLKERIYNDNDYKNDDSSLSSFIKTWTIKEAYSKFVGIGISIGLKDIEINYENGSVLHKGFTKATYKTFNIYDILISVVTTDDDEIIIMRR